MHDLTFCNEILSALNDKTRKISKGYAIKSVKVSLSPLSHVAPETLKETFAAVSKDTPFSKVKLTVSACRLGIKCDSCKKGFKVSKPAFTCPECGSQSLNIIYQKEFTVDAIDVAKPSKKSRKKTPSKRP